MRKIAAKIVFVFIFSDIGFADDGKEAPESKNYCHSAENQQEFDGLLEKYPDDKGIIKLYALRVGLCAMIDGGKVPLDEGIDLWDVERSKIIIERTNNELNANPKLIL